MRDDFHAGTEAHLDKLLGGRLVPDGAEFRVWAPNAEQVYVTGDFCHWETECFYMYRDSDGVWQLFIPNLKEFDTYKYVIKTKDGQTLYKADPMAYHAETRPGSASKLYSLPDYKWGDESFIAARRRSAPACEAMNIYEVHAPSWRLNSDGSMLSYRALAEVLIPYVKRLGFTHIELMPITEYPLDASWGYQCTGYFAVTSRMGTPEDFMYFVDSCHRAGVGVILDWVPAHFPKDPHGLVEFDGSRLYEYQDYKRAEQRSWGTRMFDLGKGEVRSFLISSAIFWLEQFHIDALRVDACASMLYLDYDKAPGDWTPNIFGGHENIEAIEFFRMLSLAVSEFDPSVLLIAEESTAWPSVTKPAERGGLGFNFKWNMGWMNDTLHYFKLDPIYRQYEHKNITFPIMYAFSENFVLPLSHDEVVHMKGSLINKMPGSDEQKRASLRLLYSYMLAQPGKKLIFMGAELGQYSEWNYASQLDWHLLVDPRHTAIQRFFVDANKFYLDSPELWQLDGKSGGFKWIVSEDNIGNTAVFIRTAADGSNLICAFNFSAVQHSSYLIEVPESGNYEIMFSSNAPTYGGSAFFNSFALTARHRGGRLSIVFDFPPLCAVFFRKEN